MSRCKPAALALIIAVSACSLTTAQAQSQHLWWKIDGQRDATCLYGEITVLATHPAIYYCGANWHPGEPAGGYCGIQHNSLKERRTIFSVWDTTSQLHPKTTDADPQTHFNRFGGEGEGAHTHMLWTWQVGDTFQFFVHKEPGSDPQTTDARYYVFDPRQKAWLHSATINSHNGDEKSQRSVATVGGGGLASFLENFIGKEKEIPKLALYRLWLGSTPDTMQCLTEATGDGHWGQLHDAYFLAEGDQAKLDSLLATLKKDYGDPTFGTKGKKLAPVSNKAIPPETLTALKNLPRAKLAKEN
jgi:hypothetical protein